MRGVCPLWPNSAVSCSESCGALEFYDKAFDRITTRNEKQLRSIKRIFHTVTTTDDPVIRKVRAPPLGRGPHGGWERCSSPHMVQGATGGLRGTVLMDFVCLCLCSWPRPWATCLPRTPSWPP